MGCQVPKVSIGMYKCSIDRVQYPPAPHRGPGKYPSRHRIEDEGLHVA